MSERRLPHPIPFGWYFISYSDELAPGEVKTVHYFKRDMILFRTESGELGLTETYCPHLGAHLGHGGVVVGESIRCPFHHWSFDNKGVVSEIPYASQIPPKIQGKPCLKTYPVCEKNQVIWAWYHPEEVEPMFDVMDHEVIGDPEWVPLKRFKWNIKSSPQEIAENGVDVAHFRYIHAMEAVPEGETTYDGHVRQSMAQGPREITDPDGSKRIITSTVRTVQNGAGQKLTRISGVTETALMVLATPIHEEEVEFRFAFTHKDFPEDSMEYMAAQGAIQSVCGQTGVEGDIPVWDNKIHKKNPILCDGDGPIMRFRRYFEQFYVEDY